MVTKKEQHVAKKAPVKKTTVVRKTPQKQEEVKPVVSEGKVTIFPASWDKEERHQFIAFLLGMIVAGAVMWGYIQLSTFNEDMSAKDRLQSVIVRNIQKNIFGDRVKVSKNRTRRKKAPVEAKPCGNPRNVVFNEAEYKAYAEKGSLSLKGNVCASLPAGVACPKNALVFVNPVTSYSTEWYGRHWVGNELLALPDKKAWNYQRRTESQPKGDFVLAELPAGSYYVGSTMCVQLKPADARCTPVRLGAKVTLSEDTQVELPIVFVGQMVPPPPPGGFPPPPHKGKRMPRGAAVK